MRIFLAVLMLSMLVSCTSLPSRFDGPAHADMLVTTRSWSAICIPSERFDLVAHASRDIHSDTWLAICIEDDGFVWLTGAERSIDPMLRVSSVLRLALAYIEGNAAYLPAFIGVLMQGTLAVSGSTGRKPASLPRWFRLSTTVSMRPRRGVWRWRVALAVGGGHCSLREEMMLLGWLKWLGIWIIELWRASPPCRVFGLLNAADAV